MKRSKIAVMAILAILVMLFAEIGIAQERQQEQGLMAKVWEQKDKKEWDKTDSILLGTAVTLLAVDWNQTRIIARNPDRFNEKNAILGNHPSVGKVNGYFAAAIIGTIGVAMALPSEYRKFWLGGITVLEVSVTQHNRSLGIKTSF